MSKLFLKCILALAVICSAIGNANAQCTTTVLDWDYREFFARNTSTIRSYVSLAQSQTQYFGFGANRITMTHNYTTDDNIVGDNVEHTGEAGSFGTGADVQFIGNGVITFTFDSAVSNLRFSMYDVDRSQRVTFGAQDGATSRNILLGTLSGSVLSITNNNSTNARVDASTVRVCNDVDDGTVNVTIAGPVRVVTLTISNTSTVTSGFPSTCTNREDGSFWISDLTACSPGNAFPNNYNAISRPFTGMPNYMITVVGNSFYYVDPNTGNARFLFQDPSNDNMNSIAYDPINRLVYYTYSLSDEGSVNPNEKALRRYDVNMDTFGVVIANISNIGLPVMGQGVESGAAAFYGDKLYWGIEGNSSTATESVIWRIDMNAQKVPNAFTQVYAQDVRNSSSSSRQHDWADFGLANGILYDFDGGVANSTTGQNCNFFQMNLLTGAVTSYTPTYNVANTPAIQVPRQTGIDWENKIYNIGPLALTGSTTGQITLYNGTNGLTGSSQTIKFNGVDLSGSWGDGAEGFRPYCDFGDAPLSYEGADPVWAPAVHEQNVNLRLGAGWSKEWLKKGNSSYDDNFDDGLAYTPMFSAGIGNYLAQASVFNNTGANARICAWLDFNKNGTFEAGEGISVTVPTSASMQNVWLAFPVTPTTLVTGDSTYLRIRLSSVSSGMTVSNPAGYFGDGETEDYRVLVDNFPLPVQLVSFEAKAVNNNYVQLDWKTVDESNIEGYQVERSIDGMQWSEIGFVSSNPSQSTNQYTLNDNSPYKGVSKYRLRIKQATSNENFSEIRSVTIKEQVQITLAPNPTKTNATLKIVAERPTIGEVRITGIQGNEMSYNKVNLTAGQNLVPLVIDGSWPAGTYMISININDVIVNKKLVVTR
jgi:hypothetical protein